MKAKRTISGTIFDICNGILMVAIFVCMVYPFLYVLNYSLSTPGKITQPLLLFPQQLTLKPYEILLSDRAFYQALFISVSRAILGPVTMLFVSGMGAYALSKSNLLFGKFFRMLVFFTMYFSAGIIPVYITMQKLGLTRNYWVYILPSMVSAYNIVLIKAYLESIPSSLEEAVLIDGGNEMHAYWRVLFPVCLPVNAAVVLFSAITHWNSYIDTQLYNAMNPELHSLQYFLYTTLAAQLQQSLEDAVRQAKQSVRINGQSLKMAITVLTVVPVMCLYPILQRYFISGIMVGSIKA
jgi:putative aldouronate transport system permease protein